MDIQGFADDEPLGVFDRYQRAEEALPGFDPSKEGFGAEICFRFGALRIIELRSIALNRPVFLLGEIADVHHESRRGSAGKHEVRNRLGTKPFLTGFAVVFSESGDVGYSPNGLSLSE